MIGFHTPLRKSAEVCGSVVLNFRRLPQNIAKSLKTLAEVVCGTVSGSCGSSISKALFSNGNSSGSSAELSVPLIGVCCALGCANTPIRIGADLVNFGRAQS